MDQAIPLFKCSFNIHEKTFARRSYDEGFRQDRAVTNYLWDINCNELYINSISQAIVDNNSNLSIQKKVVRHLAHIRFFAILPISGAGLVLPACNITRTSSVMTAVCQQVPLRQQLKGTKVCCQAFNDHLKQIEIMVKMRTLQKLLKGYNRQKFHFIIDGFIRGFNIGYSSSSYNYISRHLRSAICNPYVVSALLNDEIKLRRIAEPFNYLPFMHAIISHLV